jgi:hypothetical protein
MCPVDLRRRNIDRLGIAKSRPTRRRQCAMALSAPDFLERASAWATPICSTGKSALPVAVAQIVATALSSPGTFGTSFLLSTGRQYRHRRGLSRAWSAGSTALLSAPRHRDCLPPAQHAAGTIAEGAPVWLLTARAVGNRKDHRGPRMQIDLKRAL